MHKLRRLYETGCLLRALGRRLLHLALLHYVDDFFGGATTALADSNSAQRICCAGDRAESIEIAREVFARLVRACLGSSAISSRKLEHGSTLVILGIEIQFDAEGATFRPSPEKLESWADKIYRALLMQA